MTRIQMTNKSQYSHLFNNRGGWNKFGGGAKNTKITKRGGWNKGGGWDFLEKTST